MKNNLSDLNNHLFSILEGITDETLKEEELDGMIKRAEAACKVGEEILGVAKLQLDVLKTAESIGIRNSELPALIEVKDSKTKGAQ